MTLKPEHSTQYEVCVSVPKYKHLRELVGQKIGSIIQLARQQSDKFIVVVCVHPCVTIPQFWPKWRELSIISGYTTLTNQQ